MHLINKEMHLTTIAYSTSFFKAFSGWLPTVTTYAQALTKVGIHRKKTGVSGSMIGIFEHTT